MKKITKLITGATLAGAIVLLAGCASSNNGPITSKSFQSNPSPELTSLTRTTDQSDNHAAIVNDLNSRQIADDLAVFMLMDRPMHLSPYAMP